MFTRLMIEYVRLAYVLQKIRSFLVRVRLLFRWFLPNGEVAVTIIWTVLGVDSFNRVERSTRTLNVLNRKAESL